jgi:hypothetical protein
MLAARRADRQTMANQELYFLRSELPDSPISKGFRWSLKKVKVNQTVGGAYLAFAARDLAESFCRHLAQGPHVVSAGELDASCYFDFSKSQVVLFTDRAEVEKCLADRGAYRYEDRLMRYAP